MLGFARSNAVIDSCVPQHCDLLRQTPGIEKVM
jgi:hypothetical protein